MTRGRFITLEGGEGVGKSVQVKRLCGALSARGVPVAATREPGGTPAAEEIRALLVAGDAHRWTPLTEALLFSAARAEHLERLIRPALSQGRWVVSDRFADSTAVYQSAGRGLDAAAIATLNRLVVGEDWPDLTLILDIDVATGLARAGARAHASGSAEQRFEGFDVAFHERLRTAFRGLAAQEPARCVLIDAGGTEDEVAALIWAEISRRFGV